MLTLRQYNVLCVSVGAAENRTDFDRVAVILGSFLFIYQLVPANVDFSNILYITGI